MSYHLNHYTILIAFQWGSSWGINVMLINEIWTLIHIWISVERWQNNVFLSFIKYLTCEYLYSHCFWKETTKYISIVILLLLCNYHAHHHHHIHLFQINDLRILFWHISLFCYWKMLFFIKVTIDRQ